MISYRCPFDETEICSNNIIEHINLNKTTFNYPCSSTTECKPIDVRLKRGIYKFELWGAQGGDSRTLYNKPNITHNTGGKGACVSGILSLYSTTHLYLYIGGRGEDQNGTEAQAYGRGGFNGGGDGGIDLDDTDFPESSAGAGGATDIRLIEGDEIDVKSL